MSVQYDNISSLYHERRASDVGLKEKETVKQILSPIIKGATVLDLACGFGFYTYDLIEWGADHVTAVDISHSMLLQSKRSAGYAKHSSRVQLIEADASIPHAYPGGPFDAVIGIWFLNYAPDRETLTRMFASISLNLKDGGIFVGVLLPPSDDPVAEYDVGSLVHLGFPTLLIENAGPVADGMRVRAHLRTDRGSGEFEFFHLKKGTFESAAREGGMMGPVMWVRTQEVAAQDLIVDESQDQEERFKQLTPHFFSCFVACKTSD